MDISKRKGIPTKYCRSQKQGQKMRRFPETIFKKIQELLDSLNVRSLNTNSNSDNKIKWNRKLVQDKFGTDVPLIAVSKQLKRTLALQAGFGIKLVACPEKRSNY